MRNDLLDFLIRFRRNELIDFLTALLRIATEFATFDVTTQARLYMLCETTLSLSLLIRNDACYAVDFSGLLATALLLFLLLLLIVIFAFQTADQRSMRLLTLSLLQTLALQTLNLAFGISTRTMLQSSQTQLRCDWRNDSILIIRFLFGLFVQFCSQVAIGLFQGLEKMIARFALLLLLLLALGTITSSSTLLLLLLLLALLIV
jgi:hypothetical protein